jgi:type I restriction enzyme S subunit
MNKQEIKLTDCISLSKGKPPAQIPFYGEGAEPYLNPDYLRGKATAELAKPAANSVRVENGDTVLLWDGSNAGELFIGRNGLLASTMSRISHGDEFDREYFYYAVKRWESYLKGQTSGSGIPHVDKEILGNLRILRFELEEQTRISSILSTLDLAIEQADVIIAKQQRIKTGLMRDLLTKGIDEKGIIRSEATHEFNDSPLGRIPVEWELESLSNVVEIIDPNPSHRYPPVSDVGVPLASTENFVGDNDFDLSWADRVPYNVFEQQNKRCNYDQDDVVFARKGRLGFARPYGNEDKVFSHTVVVLKPRNGGVHPRFLLWLVRFRQFFDEIDKRMNSNSGVPTLGVAFIGAIPVMIPKPNEQIRIVALLDNVEIAAEKESTQLQKLKKIKTGLMHDLLSGKVRVNDKIQQLTAN